MIYIYCFGVDDIPDLLALFSIHQQAVALWCEGRLIKWCKENLPEDFISETDEGEGGILQLGEYVERSRARDQVEKIVAQGVKHCKRI